jgi:Domain of unknown function (DUF4132)
MTTRTPAAAAAEADGRADLAWIPAAGGYQLTLDGGDLLCRNPAGKVLRSLPKSVRESAAAERLRALRDWLDRHEADCRAAVETWMLGSMPVPAVMVASVWPDPAWRSQLADAVVTAAGAAGPVTGFLRAVDGNSRLGLVNLDGETEWLACETLVIPHPVRLDELDDFREFALELGIEQRIQQLLRDVHRKPDDLAEAAAQARAYAGGRFAELRHALARATGLGFRVRGGYATCRAFDDGGGVEGRYWLGADHPEGETWTGELVWVDDQEQQLDLAQVGPVAWSEGTRMAALVYAARVTEGEE